MIQQFGHRDKIEQKSQLNSLNACSNFYINKSFECVKLHVNTEFV